MKLEKAWYNKSVSKIESLNGVEYIEELYKELIIDDYYLFICFCLYLVECFVVWFVVCGLFSWWSV